MTPLGDPPLFLGFLKGVEFFWTLKNILPETLFLWAALLGIFYWLDRYYWQHHDVKPVRLDPTPDSRLRIEGKTNVLLLVVIVGLVLMSGLWKPGIQVQLLGVAVALQNLVRDGLLLAVILASWFLTPAAIHRDNEFSWEPMREVAKLFAAIFITIAPVMAMLKAGTAGSFAAVVHAITDASGRPIDLMYFWSTGMLSAFLDNAPTYLVFFNAAGGDAAVLMTKLAGTFAAISCGAVFMGALTYIGNAPNLMVKAIAEQRGIRMPTFFGYMAWSCGILLPLFLVMSLLFF